MITRFAPSPTGALHIGGARTALFSWAFARRHGGRFILRMEDTDRARSTAESANSIIRDLEWLGIDWDQGPMPSDDPGTYPFENQKGEKGPYFQSQRLDIYNEHVDRLIESGRAYVPADEPQIVRFRMGEDVAFDDLVYGHVAVKGSELEDFVIRKSDGFPTFHLAVVVDDALMDVTHVIRGQEHISNTPKHVALQDALGFERPDYAHTPSILNADGSKMSKRDKAKAARKAVRDACPDEPSLEALANRVVERIKTHGGIYFETNLLGQEITFKFDRNDLDAFLAKKNDDPNICDSLAHELDIDLPEIDVSDFRRGGYSPDALCNYISLLGWNPGDDVELFDREFLIDRFDLNRINKANSRFDRKKLLAFNGDAIRELTPNDWATQLRSHLDLNHPAFECLCGHPHRFGLFAAAYQQRSQTLEEPTSLGRFFVLDDEAIDHDPKAVRKVLERNDGEGLKVLAALRQLLAGSVPWQAQHLEQQATSHAEQQGLGMGQVAQPLRVAVSGTTVSPPIFETLEILGEDSTLRRIDHCLEVCGIAER